MHKLLKALLPKLKKTALSSLALFFIIAVPSAIVSSIAHRQFDVRYTFDANFIAAVIVIAVALIVNGVRRKRLAAEEADE